MCGSQSRLQSITVDIKQELEAAIPVHPQPRPENSELCCLLVFSFHFYL